ncbi:hypothetical protein [Ralstonia pseudosolanacearum]|uniref:hypothetical protein n=1 Tax=Ralstonia pseudosolanacearum TaxID=1310165 RepID=UPI000676A09E|nr:hypothetical protein [Ralstonia pseudosolanacearum]MDO3558179.1 hypothetical protein [Ralstonia pseudosolanacearum]MDO3577734.1 hypothetical protein [Ralstonia pseudosolanacearum]MDO3586813.1 hypothetical protein [Ralstonia pseudosolanacearum]
MTTKYPQESGTSEPTRKTIKLTPTWASLLGVYLAVLEDGNAEGRRIAKEELARMAQAADQWNNHCEAQEAARATN